MEISTLVFDTKAKWPRKFPRRFLIQKLRQNGMEISTSVFDTKAKWPWKFPTSFVNGSAKFPASTFEN